MSRTMTPRERALALPRYTDKEVMGYPSSYEWVNADELEAALREAAPPPPQTDERYHAPSDYLIPLCMRCGSRHRAIHVLTQCDTCGSVDELTDGTLVTYSREAAPPVAPPAAFLDALRRRLPACAWSGDIDARTLAIYEQAVTEAWEEARLS